MSSKDGDRRASEIEKKLDRASKALKKADQLVEQAAMDTFEVYRMLKFGKTPLTGVGEVVMDRADRAHSKTGDARGAIGDAHYQVEQALKGRR